MRASSQILTTGEATEARTVVSIDVQDYMNILHVQFVDRKLLRRPNITIILELEERLNVRQFRHLDNNGGNRELGVQRVGILVTEPLYSCIMPFRRVVTS